MSERHLHRGVIGSGVLCIAIAVLAPTAGRATSVSSVTKKVARAAKTTVKRKVAAPSSSVAPSTVVSTAAPASTTLVPLVLDYDKVLNGAAPVEADLGPGYQYLSDPTLSSNDARYRSAMSRVGACNGFADSLPFFAAKARAVRGWTYRNGGRSATFSIVLTADDATARSVLESVRTFAAFPACNSGFTDVVSKDAALANPTLSGKVVTVMSANSRFGLPLPSLGDDQVAIAFDQITTIDGVAQPPVTTLRRIARFGPAIMTYTDDPQGADQIASKLGLKLVAALKP